MFILNTKDNLVKLVLKFDVGIFLGYSNTSKAYKVYNLPMQVIFNEFNPSSIEKVVVNDDTNEE